MKKFLYVSIRTLNYILRFILLALLTGRKFKIKSMFLDSKSLAIGDYNEIKRL